MGSRAWSPRRRSGYREVMRRRSFATVLAAVLAGFWATGGVPASGAQASGAPTTATAGASPACRTPALHIRQLFSSGATGHVLHVFTIANVSGRTCHTFGYFGTQLLDKRGRNLETRAHRVTHDFFGRQPKHH